MAESRTASIEEATPIPVEGPPEIASGVLAMKFDTEDGLYFPIVEAVTPGNGAFGRWLDPLPIDRRIVFPTVLSGRLKGMLERRGYHVEYEWSDVFEEDVELYVREAKHDD